MFESDLAGKTTVWENNQGQNPNPIADRETVYLPFRRKLSFDLSAVMDLQAFLVSCASTADSEHRFQRRPGNIFDAGHLPSHGLSYSILLIERMRPSNAPMARC